MIPLLSLRVKLAICAGIGAAIAVGVAIKRAERNGAAAVLLHQNIAKSDSLTHDIVPLKRTRAKAKKSFASADSSFRSLPSIETATTAVDAAETTVAVSDTLIAKQDTLIVKLNDRLALKYPAPNRIIPYVRVDYRVDSTAWTARAGIDARLGRLRIGPAVERRRNTTELLISGQWDFR